MKTAVFFYAYSYYYYFRENPAAFFIQVESGSK